MRLLHRPRRHLALGNAVVGALVGEPFPRPCAGHQVEGLLEAADPLLPRDAVSGELLGDVAGRDPEHEPSAGQIVDHGDVFRELQRRIERHEENARPDPHALGDRRRPRHGDQGARAEAVLLDMVGSLERRPVTELLRLRQATEHVPVRYLARDTALRRRLMRE